MSPEASVFSTRYVSAVGVATLIYDHLLTFGDGLDFIWLNSAAGIGNRLCFILNRCKIFIWIYGSTSLVFITVSHFVIIGRVYTLWDRRRRIKWILITAFGVAVSVSVAFSTLAAYQVQQFVDYNPFINMCTFAQKPGALKYSLASLTVFDLFIIVMSLFYALEKPHQRQADVMISLQHDGALLFVCLFLLRLVALIISIVGEPANCFVTLIFVWTMCSIANSRLQLWVEALRFIRFALAANQGSNMEYELQVYEVSG
ncbi:hypothetical protein C8J57DRAFT_1712828 [Mycena rebaudengoi]|nr:hypothetical protein C8J57DRAFT_1712828 [Mycena rebaudengoi]